MVIEFTNYFNTLGLELEGIFRISGQKSLVDQLKKDFEESKVTNLEIHSVQSTPVSSPNTNRKSVHEALDPNVVSGVLKLFLVIFHVK